MSSRNIWLHNQWADIQIEDRGQNAECQWIQLIKFTPCKHTEKTIALSCECFECSPLKWAVEAPMARLHLYTLITAFFVCSQHCGNFARGKKYMCFVTSHNLWCQRDIKVQINRIAEDDCDITSDHFVGMVGCSGAAVLIPLV